MSEHVFAEAFKLMWYGCKCGHRERIWNSRNGVTPFCLSCPSCGSMTLEHVYWNHDTLASNHKLNPGQRFFRDGTPDEAAEIMRRRIERINKQEGPLTVGEDEARRLIEGARNAHKTGNKDFHEFQKGWPTLDRQSDIGREKLT